MKEESDQLSHTIADLCAGQEQAIEETSILIMEPMQQQQREEKLQSEMTLTISNVVSLTQEMKAEQWEVITIGGEN